MKELVAIELDNGQYKLGYKTEEGDKYFLTVESLEIIKRYVERMSLHSSVSPELLELING